MDEPTATELRELLSVVLDGLTMPYAATAAGDDRRTAILLSRVTDVTVTLRAVLREDQKFLPISHDIDYLRERLAERPALGYVTQELARERQEAGEDYMTSVREDFPDHTEESEQK